MVKGGGTSIHRSGAWAFHPTKICGRPFQGRKRILRRNAYVPREALALARRVRVLEAPTLRGEKHDIRRKRAEMVPRRKGRIFPFRGASKRGEKLTEKRRF